MPQVACLGGIGLLHLFEQKLPSFILRLDFPFLSRGKIESLGRIAQPFASDRTSNLFERTMCPQDLALDSFKLQPYYSRSIPSGADLLLVNYPLGDRKGRVRGDIRMIEDETKSRPTPIEFEMAYQARVAIDRIRFAIKQTEQFAPKTDQMREVGLQLLDALGRLESADRTFQESFRGSGRLQDHPVSANRLNGQAGKSEGLRNV